MADAGVKSTHLTNRVPLIDEIIGNRAGSTALQPVSDLNSQLAFTGAIASEFQSVRDDMVKGLLTEAAWTGLSARTSTTDGAGGQVLDGDTGTHPAATSTGYNGAAVSNAGRYRYNLAWGRWVRIGDNYLTPATSDQALAGAAADKTMTPATTKVVLDDRMSDARFVRMAPESGFVGAIVDGAGRACLMIAADGTVTGKIRMGQQTVSYDNLASDVTGLVGKAMPIESGAAYAIVDADGRACLTIDLDGTVNCRIRLADGSVGYDMLGSDVTGLFGQAMSSETGFAYAIVDANGRIAFGIDTSGGVTVRVSTLIGKSVSADNLTDSLSRNVVPRSTDVVAAKPDRWRQRTGEIALTTMTGDGSLWKPFPARSLRLLRGLNKSGQSIEIRKSLGLQILGTSYGGTWSPGSWPSTNYKGVLAGPVVSAPSGSFNAGDYFLYVNGTDATSTGDFSDMKVGDALVYGADSAWHIQTAPGTRGSRAKNAWWTVSAAGSFDGLTYAVGDRILYIGPQPGGGGWQYERWHKIDVAKGDLCYRGEFAPSGGLPASPTNGELYQTSAAGIAGGLTFAGGDCALYADGGWQQITNSAASTYPANASITLPCIADASEWEVRRADKSATSVGVRLSAQMQVNARRHQDFLWLISDSMYGTGGTGGLVLSKSARQGIVTSYGGGKSSEILGMMEYEIARQGDAFAGAIIIPWHGQNNQPGISEANAAQIREASLAMYELIGSRDRRALFLSVLGQRTFTWNGSRLVASQHEDQKAKTGALYELKAWYDATFPGLAIHPYDALIAAAAGRNIPDPHFPGMTEAQVAATYGIVPRSFFGGAALPVSPSALVYQGTWSTAGVPTGGTANDYYIRIANGTTGALLINVAGTWIEWTWDATHLSTIGAGPLSDAIIATINTRYY
jgi:hypothetical protein